MLANLISRRIRRRIQAIILWMMVPVAAINGQSVMGCISPNGHFDPTCQCWAGQESSGTQATAPTHHCACCGTSHCCCKNKSSTNSTAAQQTRASDGPGLHVHSRCRPFTAYFTVTAVNGLHRTVLVHSSVGCLDQTVDMPAIAVGAGVKYVSQLNTGPPPDNLTVALHRWVI
jgi:hypothetical protein